MFTIKHRVSETDVAEETEVVYGGVDRVSKSGGSVFVHIGGEMNVINEGTVYVMNDKGSTVATYFFPSLNTSAIGQLPDEDNFASNTVAIKRGARRI